MLHMSGVNCLKLFFQMQRKKKRSVDSSSLKPKGSDVYAYVFKCSISQLYLQNMF